MGLILDATLDSNIIACRLKIYFHYLGRIPKSFLNSLQALRLSLAQYSRTMLRCYLKICHRTPALWSWARTCWSTLQTPPWPHSSFPFQLRMKGWWKEGWWEKKREGGILFLAFFGMLFFSSFPSSPSVSCLQHDTSARLGSATLEVCVCVCARVLLEGLWLAAIHLVIYVGTNWPMWLHVIQVWYNSIAKNVWEPLTSVTESYWACSVADILW